MSKNLTYQTLKEKRACAKQLALFHKLFGDSVEVTKELCVKHAADFDWTWAANNLLSTPAREAYYKAVAPALEAYNKAVAPAGKAYDKAVAPAWAQAYLTDN